MLVARVNAPNSPDKKNHLYKLGDVGFTLEEHTGTSVRLLAALSYFSDSLILELHYPVIGNNIITTVNALNSNSIIPSGSMLPVPPALRNLTRYQITGLDPALDTLAAQYFTESSSNGTS